MRNNRYALLTVDTEALPRRASEKHVERLMWGKHEQGTVGIAEMCAVGDVYGIKHTFFVDLCATYADLAEVQKVIEWLLIQGQDVQLHTHPEYLPGAFKKKHGLHQSKRHMNFFDAQQNLFVVKFFSELMASITKKPVRAFRAGSFRWNAGTLSALKKCNIPLSFNNSVVAMRNGQCPFSIEQNHPFQWSNGVYEVPVTEQNFLRKQKYRVRLHYPSSGYLQLLPRWLSFFPTSIDRSNNFLVVLLHSWSFLHWNENNYAIYKDFKRVEQYHTFVKRLSKDYDIITATELLDLFQSNKLSTSHVEDMGKTIYVPPPSQ